MKTYGLRKKLHGFVGKVDYHIHIGFKKIGNWWEELDADKTRARQQAKKQIQKELKEDD